MVLKQLPSEFPIFTFTSPAELEALLDREHQTANGFYIKLAKKASGIASITAPEAVEVCLMFGWIDGGGGGTIDEKYWLTRYTPRRPRSTWSKKNTDTVARLIQDGKMRPAGLAAVDAAKADGRWGRAYDGKSVPDDFAAALAAEPEAMHFFQGLIGSNRYAVLHRVQTASLKTRDSGFAAIVQQLASGQVPGRPASTPMSNKKNKSVRSGRIAKRATLDKPIPSPKATLTPRREGLRPRG